MFCFIICAKEKIHNSFMIDPSAHTCTAKTLEPNERWLDRPVMTGNLHNARNANNYDGAVMSFR